MTSSAARPVQRAGLRIIRPLRDFLETEVSGGILVLGAAVVALVWANSPWKAAYESLWRSEAAIRLAGHVLTLDLRHIVNDGLMTLFFFVVGLEIKRELTDGELREPRRAALPVIAALGGMAVPALLYLAFNVGGHGGHGWGIPMATDIAMALGVLRFVAPRIHPSVKLFLLTLAIVDDIGAILVIAFFYSTGVDARMLLGAAAMLALVFFARFVGAQSIVLYSTLGIALWWFVHEAGIHATIAGVVLALLAPARPKLTQDLIEEDKLVDLSNLDAVRETMMLARQSVSVVEWLEDRLHPWTSYVIVPLFALANAGITISGRSIREATTSRVAVGIVVGLVIGKAVGITFAAWVALRFRVAELPEGLTLRSIMAVAALGGIGFTVSLFVAALAFSDPTSQANAKIGIVTATLIAGLFGIVLIRRIDRTDAGPQR